MKNILLFVSIYMCTISCNNSFVKTEKTEINNSLTEEEKKNGWELLFDGNTTKGWHKYGDVKVGTAWKVKDSMLFLDATEKGSWQTKNGGDIVTDAEFENFDLKYDWKIDTCGNSGVIFYVKEDTAKYEYVWETGPEMQVLDNNCHPDGKLIKHRAGDLYGLIASNKEMAKPSLEWNTAEIKCVNGILEFFLNREKIISTTLWDSDWKKLIAASKFIEMPDFGTYKKGHIAIQDHGNNVWYRNMKIKKL